MNVFPCDQTYDDLLAFLDPTQQSNFLNEDYEEPTDLDPGSFSVEFKYNGSWYEFGKYYVPKSAEIEDIFSFETGQFSFQLWDFQETFNWWFLPVGNQQVRLRNLTQNKTYARGRVQDLNFFHKNRRVDGTERKIVEFICLDLKEDFKRFLYSESYTAITTYGVIKDAVQNHTPFDASEIDETKGLLLDSYKVNKRFASDVVQEMIDLEVTTTIYVDPDTLKVYVAEKHTGTMNVLQITEANIYDYFDIRDFFINRQTTILRNRVHFWFNGLYDTGTVAVTNGGQTVIGTGTLWASHIKPGSVFKASGSSDQYTVEAVNSDTDIRLSSLYAGSTDTGIGYTLSGHRDYVIVDDSENVATMARILGETSETAGIFEVKIPDKPNPLTRAQARQFARSYVNRLTNNLILKGQSKSTNYKLLIDPRAGQSVSFNLPISRRIQAHATFQRIVLEDLGGLLDRTIPGKRWYDGVSKDPILGVTMEYTDRRLYQEKIIEKLLQQQTDVQITDDEIVEAVARASEVIFMGDCAGLVTSLGPNRSSAEKITLSDAADSEEVTPASGYYTAPIGGGQTEAYCAASGIISFTS